MEEKTGFKMDMMMMMMNSISLLIIHVHVQLVCMWVDKNQLCAKTACIEL